jgi:transcriptional regulator with XRE-family HTH domain
MSNFPLRIRAGAELPTLLILRNFVRDSEYVYTIEDKVSVTKDKVTERVALAVRDRREQQRLTLRELSATSGVSSSMISDIERGAKSPTIATLSALAEALGVTIATLVDVPVALTGRIHVVRASERTTSSDPTSGARRDSFKSPLTTSKVEFSRYTVPRRAMAGPFAAHATGTIEHMYLAAGSIVATFGVDSVTLGPGDCCSCAADAPHSFDNRSGKVEASIYIVLERP